MEEPPSGKFVSSNNIQKRLRWCRDHKGIPADQWKEVIFSDEFSFSLFLTAGRVFVWRQHMEAYNPDCPFPTVKHGYGSMTVWAAISWNSLDLIVTLHGRINSKDYLNILEDHAHPMVQAFFPDGNGIF